MDQILDGGIAVILWLQQFGPAPDSFFKALTILGDEAFFLVSLPCIYWCLCKKTGARLSVLFLVSAYINMAAKLIADQPRPFEYSDAVRQVVAASGGGFPSGHTQGAVVFWGYLAWTFKNRFFRTLACLLILGIPLSRMYLGVHFPSDLIGGYLIGSVMLFLFIKAEASFTDWQARFGFSKMVLAAIVIPGLMALLLTGDKTAVASSAALCGMGTGFLLENRYIDFQPAENWRNRLLTYILGIVVFALIYVGLKIVFTGAEPAPLFRFARYAIAGFWGGVGAPWLFTRLKWSHSAGLKLEQ